MKFRLLQVAIALDQLANALHGGWADESISSRAWRLRHRWPYRAYVALIDGVFFWQGGHCEASYAAERARAHLPPELRLDNHHKE